MTYEWGRFIWWLGQNASAIQALAAIATTLLTLALVWATSKYVVLTQRILATSEKQLIAQYQPHVKITLNATLWTGEVKFTIQNAGTRTIKLVAVNVGWTYPDNPLMWGRLGMKIQNRTVLEPAESISFDTKIRRDIEEVPAEFFNEITIYVDCADLNAPEKHSFSYSRNGGLQYSDRFRAHWTHFDSHVSYVDSLS